MTITEDMKTERALEYLEAELEQEKKALNELDDKNVKIREVIVMRNKKVMYIADIEQMVRNAKYKIEKERIRESIRKHPAILQGGLGE